MMKLARDISTIDADARQTKTQTRHCINRQSENNARLEKQIDGLEEQIMAQSGRQKKIEQKIDILATSNSCIDQVE